MHGYHRHELLMGIPSPAMNQQKNPNLDVFKALSSTSSYAPSLRCKTTKEKKKKKEDRLLEPILWADRPYGARFGRSLRIQSSPQTPWPTRES
jgi:hypothetical protein